ncbi:MAG: DUF2461 domain-containing protein [Deltaproteobacteria bacterium]|nr:DUF2461 domain-containing protein [Deltaproteobacteria bacterium]
MTDFAGFSTTTLDFLRGLAAHNDKGWFDANKKAYKSGFTADAKAFVSALGEHMAEMAPDLHAEPRVNGSIFRINRDTRFSKDKTPYKTHMDLMFWLGEGRSRECAALFFRMGPDSLHVGGGLHMFDKPVLEAFRASVTGAGAAELDALVAGLDGYTLGAEDYKRVPRGYDAEHPHAHWLKHKSIHAGLTLDPLPEELTTDQAVEFVAGHFERLLPLTRWVSALVEGTKA